MSRSINSENGRLSTADDRASDAAGTIEKVNYFDKLSNDLVVKILRNFVEDTKEGSATVIKNLLMTSKRFNYIVNEKLYTTSDDNQVPFIDVERRSRSGDRPERCEFTDCPECYCKIIRQRANHRFIKYRHLSLINLDLIKGCVLKAIEDEHEKLNSIHEIYFERCKMDVDVLDKLMELLPNAQRLYLAYPKSWPKLKRASREVPLRTLGYLGFVVEGEPRNFFEIIKKRLTARIIDFELDGYTQANRDWVREYLLLHRAKIEHFGVKLIGCRGDTVRALFEGFEIKSRYRFLREAYEIISASCPQSIVVTMFQGAWIG